MVTLLYEELRRLAAARMHAERADHTLTATDLVSEAYMRLAKENHGWGSRLQFFAAAGQAMKRVLIDHARKRASMVNGGGMRRVDASVLDGVSIRLDMDIVELEALDAALQRLEEINPTHHLVVMLRYFAGLSNEEVARETGMSATHARRHWQAAQVWLHNKVAGQRTPTPT